MVQRVEHRGSDDAADLLRRVAKDDHAAFRALYDRYAAKVYGIALKICGERVAAEDALQEAFTDIWHKSSSFNPARGKGEAWICIIARSRAIDIVRRRGRDTSHLSGSSVAELLAHADPSQHSDGGVDFLALMQCLSELEARDRDAVLLAYYEGASREELASHFNAPVNTVKTWLRRALASLRSCLDN